VSTGYALAVAAVVPVAAWSMGRFGAKRLYLVAVMALAAIPALLLPRR